MPELPDVEIYVERLRAYVEGHVLQDMTIASPFVVRTVDPPIAAVRGRSVVSVRRLAKRIVLGFDGDLFLVIHLMIAGRLRWRETGRKLGGRPVLAALTFEHGTLYLTEAGTKRRAMVHLVTGADSLSQFDRGGLDVLTADAAAFAERLRSESHTVKRALTDPRLFSGIGNAYSDEILHRARLSPLVLTRKLTDTQIGELLDAARGVLAQWTARLRERVGDGFPEQVTAFQPGMAVHGRFGQPCPICGAPVQRIRYADNETNYCARCQTGGRRLADRAMSQLLRDDWPRNIDEIE